MFKQKPKPDISFATKSGHLHLLPTAREITAVVLFGLFSAFSVNLCDLGGNFNLTQTAQRYAENTELNEEAGDLTRELVGAFDFDLLNGAAATPEYDAHRVGPAVEGSFDESSILSQRELEFVQHATVARWMDHISQ